MRFVALGYYPVVLPEEQGGLARFLDVYKRQGLLLLTGCAQPAAQAGGGGGTIDAINHTKWAINHFSINGQSGIDSIGPFQGLSLIHI